MKRNIPRLFPVLLALLLLAGCGGATESARTAMRLEPVALSENETELLALANADPAKFALYAYRADENLRAISVRRYVLNDALEWEQDAAYTNAVFDETLSPTGRIGLMETDGGSYSYNLRTGGVGYAVPAPALPDGLPGNASEGMGRLDGGGEIVYGQEIPLLLHTL
ncbi:MAG: hypothetical protein Q4C72_08140, partial [Eubacteriales bacterium]|nr:hypothetical protein [Eubacteriales bacterium]